jgi:hypothetical protein
MRLRCTRAASTVDGRHPPFVSGAELSLALVQNNRSAITPSPNQEVVEKCEPSGWDEHENDTHRNLKNTYTTRKITEEETKA